MLDDWYHNIADGQLTFVCSFDIKKCFDTINHFIIFKKMEKYGFSTDIADWFRSYLNEIYSSACFVIMNYLGNVNSIVVSLKGLFYG